MEHSIGIDLGTAYFTAADWVSGSTAFHTGKPRLLARIPAFARMLPNGGAICGEKALEARYAYALSTVDQIKRFLGRSKQEAKFALEHVVWKPEKNPADKEGFLIDAWTGYYRAEEIAAEILRELKTQAEQALNERISSAVFTIPAAATNNQRLALKHAAQIAGFKVQRIVHEPMAIAIAEASGRLHGRPASRLNSNPKRWAIVSFGAGMTDVAMVRIGSHGVAVESVVGNTNLGSAAIKGGIVQLIKKRFFSKNLLHIDQTRSVVRAELLLIAEETLQALSGSPAHRIDLKAAAFSKENLSIDLDMTVTRDDLKSVSKPFMADLSALAIEAMRRADCRPEEIEKVVLAGCGALIEPVQRAVADVFLKVPSRSSSPFEQPAIGAATIAASLDGRINLPIQDVLAYGLGVTLVDDGFSLLLPAGSAIPNKFSGQYTTVEDFQEKISFEIREGDRPLASQNSPLGTLLLSGILRAKAGVPKIRVTFNIDNSGILNVEAYDLHTGVKQSASIERSASPKFSKTF